jgi:glycosyltransferase involved in cell wall biosynthesis
MISVLIPAYNCARTIRMTLNSVLRQTLLPDEILVVDDGSTDDTPSILDSYGSQITVISQRNAGAAAARNVLCRRARGNLIAFIDSDDLWHPQYIETQNGLFRAYPNAGAFFTGHVDFSGSDDFAWDKREVDARTETQLIEPLEFLKRYNAAPGPFNMSFCCVSKRVLSMLGDKPFKAGVAEDCHFHNSLALCGPIVYASKELAAYRIIAGSLSADRVKWTGAVVGALELLEKRYRNSSESGYHKVFAAALSSDRRSYAKLLLGRGRASEARRQLNSSVASDLHPASLAKSLTLLLLSYLPKAMQPRWPSSRRGSPPAN